MTSDPRPADLPPACARFEAHLGPWLEHDLDAASALWMAEHRASCAACGQLVHDLERLVHDAAALPTVQPSRDLWTEIEARLEAPVIPLSAAAAPASTPHRPPHGRRTLTVRAFAVAATLLVAVSSTVTWRIATRRGSGEVAPVVSEREATRAPRVAAVSDSQANATGDGIDVIDAVDMVDASDAADLSVTYEREIVALRRIVDERFVELDPATVTELQRNLDIIDQAIRDSRAALTNDPRSGVVARQLDRALQAKLDLLRRVALL